MHSLFRKATSLVRRLSCLIALAPLAAFVPARAASQWPEMTRENKPWTRWWWPGSAVDRDNLRRELEAIAAAGFGGVEITPIYGAKGAEARFIDFLSPKYVEMLKFTADEAKRLGLAVDMATGTGWPFGGAQVTGDDAELMISINDGKLVQRPTGFHVKRSAPGARGLVVNPFSTAALEHYLAPFDKALDSLPPGTLHGQFHDSFEYTANWARELPDRFLSMHGYDIRTCGAELSGSGDSDTIARIKSDYRETLAQLHLDFVNAWVEWTHRKGGIARNQAHGAPGNLLDLYAASDIPETEIFGSHQFPIPGFRRETGDYAHDAHPALVHRFASSAAHVAGRKYASSETFTWLREHFREAPSQMKPEADLLFLTGINHIFYHGTCYSPADAQWPGWLFYASSQFNPRNSLWSEFSSLNAYIARAQSLLQSGTPDNELLVYWPVFDLYHQAEGWQRQLTVQAKDWLMKTETGALASQLDKEGFQYDFISDAQLLKCSAKNSDIKTEGSSNRAILVPRTGHMPLATFQHLIELAGNGAKVCFVGALPTDVPGLGHLKERRDQFRALLTQLQQNQMRPDADCCSLIRVGKGRLWVGPSAKALLAKLALVPESAPSLGIQLLRRRTDDGYLYFVVNQSAQDLDTWVKLSRPATSACLLDPRTGAIGTAALHAKKDACEVYLQLRSGESIFVKTRDQAPALADESPWTYQHSVGAPLPLSGTWKLNFVSGSPVLPPASESAALGSWTALGGEAERFAGTARYEIEFALPEGAMPDDWALDLGDVRETARVFVNGTEVDRLWSLPFTTSIGAALKPGKNTLVLEVTNVSANRIRDLDKRGVAWKRFHEINFVNIKYQPFNASTWSLQPSGLLGPVTLRPLKRFQP